MNVPGNPIFYSDDVEQIPADEVEDIERIVAAIRTLLERSRARTGEFHSDVHVKTHAYADAQFQVLPNLPSELAQGLFENPATYPAVLRFSNSAPQALADAAPDGRGLAIKVKSVDGESALPDVPVPPTQDFLMINHPVFFARNVKEFLRLEQVLVESDDSTLSAIQGVVAGDNWNPLHWHWRQLLNITRIAGHLPAHPASNTYFSMAPIRYGNYVAKYRVKPMGDRQDTYLDLIKRLGTQKDALRLALEETLRNESITFAFQVQLCTSIADMPIEDATVEWSEAESPFRTVAHLLIPRQEISGFRRLDEYRDLAFSVWHALEAHRPLGGINRARRWAYPVSASWRRMRGCPVDRHPGNG